jgi:hypothetical protein
VRSALLAIAIASATFACDVLAGPRPTEGVAVAPTLAPARTADATVTATATTSAPASATVSPAPAPSAATPTSATGTTAAAATATPLPTTVVGGVVFEVVAGLRADVFIEPAGAQKSVAIAGIDQYAAYIETNFARSFARRPQVYIFATDASYVAGVQAVFGYPAGTSSGLSFGDRVAVKSYQVAGHELTHVMIGQIAPQGVAPWINEGTAYLDHWLRDDPDSLWESRYRVASRFHLGTLQPLTTCASTNTRACAVGVEMLRADLGRTSFVRLFDIIGSGLTLDAAYAQITGRPLGEFLTSFPNRAAAVSTAYPGIGFRVGSLVSGRYGLNWSVFGIPQSTTVTMTVNGENQGLCGRTNFTMDADGVRDGFCTMPAGLWTVRVTWPGGDVSRSVSIP